MGRIHQRALKSNIRPEGEFDYSNFAQLDGRHSWQQSVNDACVLYPVRKLNVGQVLYFNFNLAKEMGLIRANHPNQMNKKLEKQILDTFAIRIINEYDLSKNILYHPTVRKKNMYMATRYLQLQHKDKTGKTSGDGRSIWNGQVEHQGKIWDVSSRGTGVTKLSPGAVEANRPLKSGSQSFGYGCGLADIDELIGAALMAEIFHNHEIHTERVLAVIDLGDGNGIGVRAGHNLFRPAHLFLHLKQNNYDSLKQATDFVINRQFKNKKWRFDSSHMGRYNLMLDAVVNDFAYFSSQLDRSYIFAWLDWDGDNVLIDAGIIDYGSIRQFGLRHDEYRYDDVDRFSTNLKEQKLKARLIVQVFAQLTDYLNTGKKKALEKFKNCKAVLNFETKFEFYLYDHFLKQLGLNRNKRTHLLNHHFSKIEALYTSFNQLESVKTKGQIRKVPDGLNRPAIFNMRTFLFVLPQYLCDFENISDLKKIKTQLLFEMMLAETARGNDRLLSRKIAKKIRLFIKNYIILLKILTENEPLHSVLKNSIEQSLEINRPDRVTGDGLLHVVDEILKHFKKNKDNKVIQETIDQFVAKQSPPHKQAQYKQKQSAPSKNSKALYSALLTLIDGCKESI